MPGRAAGAGGPLFVVMTDPGQITMLLSAARNGDRAAMDAVFALVYDEIKTVARSQMHQIGRPATLNTTAVVHETYLKVASRGALSVDDRRHFMALAARAVRHVLVDHARARLTAKRGAGERPLPLEAGDIPVEARAAEIVDLDAALERLAALSERLARVIELRFFGGLSVPEVAEMLGVTERTVKRDWRKARAILFDELTATEGA